MNIEGRMWKEGWRRGLSPSTVRTYIYIVKKFLRIYRKDPFHVTKNDIQRHLDHLLRWDQSGSTMNVHLAALKFFYEKVIGKRLTICIDFNRKPKRLPTVLTQEETRKFFQFLRNRKHWLIILLLYSAGLRVSEVVSLRVKNLHLDESYGWVRNGKGRKDRIFIVAKKLREELQQWIKDQQLSDKDWLFSGYGFSHYSVESVRMIIKKARRMANISKNVTPHTLRHSFATHLAENGYSLLEIQPLLGHKNLDTTMIYTHLAAPKLCNVKSPYDTLVEENKSGQEWPKAPG